MNIFKPSIPYSLLRTLKKDFPLQWEVLFFIKLISLTLLMKDLKIKKRLILNISLIIGGYSMLSVEDYIARRKKEDNLNEFDIEAKNENLRICVNYVFEYFNQYLDIDKMEKKTFLNNERLEKFKKQLNQYNSEIQNWLVDVYDVHEKQIHRSIINFLKKEDLFLLYHTDDEFRSCSYDCYAELIKKNPFLKNQAEMIFLFIKEYHAIQSVNSYNKPRAFLTEEFNHYFEKTWNKYKVNIWLFAENYLHCFFDDHSLWPAKHKIKNKEDWQSYTYDYKQRSNLFNLNTLYPRISKKPFMKGKKQDLEMLMMYIWLHDIEGDEKYWEEYFHKYTSK